MTAVVAVDFGATSIRVCRVDLDASPLVVDVVHRYEHKPILGSDGSLRWDWPRLMRETQEGLNRALEAGPVASIGVDTWGVDYGLLDRKGALLSPPHCYRSDRTAGYRDVADRIGERRLYDIAGVQLQPFNAIFQVAAHDRTELARARHLLLLPDLVVHELTGAVATELTAAGTTGLLDITARDWSAELIASTGAESDLFGPLVAAGEPAGSWNGVPVHYVGGHDTASAVAAMGPIGGRDVAFVATGTWMLVGREQDEADTSEAARTANFTNEIGVTGDVRFLKNLAGFWLIEECRRNWGGVGVPALMDEAAEVSSGFETFDVSDARFLHPIDMEKEIRDAAAIATDDPRSVVVRAAVESMAAGAAKVIDFLGGIKEIALMGGGARFGLLADAVGRATGLRVRTGPTEAAALGNALVQGMAIGRYVGLAEARAGL